MFNGLKMALTAAAAVLLTAGAAMAEVRVQGGGASFPAPLYAKWTAAFNEKNPGIKVDYQGSGSGAGIKGITDRTLHFGATDGPMTEAQEKAAPAKLLHIPTVSGPVAMIYNLPGLSGELKLNGDIIAGIYLGQINRWDDAKIKALNPDLNLPSRPIIVAHRSDGSGTTYIFTDYLAKVSDTWKEKVGTATAVEWPKGLGGKGNPGVADVVKKTVGSIGYVESAYATVNKLPYATLINKAGKEVKPTSEAVEAAAAEQLKTLPANMKVSITDSADPAAYPIAGFTYLLVYEDLSYLKDKELAKAMVKYIDWAVTDGQEVAVRELGYSKLPKEVSEKVDAVVKTIKFDGEPLLK